jgi:ubiquinone/menaquinone biosynthesis C-methylase UbiE
MKQEATIFDFQAEAGLTKHLGSFEATVKLAQLCHIDADSYVLDAGCGAGMTPYYLAKTYGCRVVGVDIRERMVQRSRERAQRGRLESLLEFRVANIQELPFEEETFDVLLSESVTVFPPDKQQTMRQYLHVLKPGGYVGLNESTWLKMPVPDEIMAWAAQDYGAQITSAFTAEGWAEQLRQAGFADVSATIYHLDLRSSVSGFFKRYGMRNVFRAWGRALRMYVRDPDYRAFLQKTRKGGVMPENLFEYLCYGLYVARKPMEEAR